MLCVSLTTWSKIYDKSCCIHSHFHLFYVNDDIFNLSYKLSVSRLYIAQGGIALGPSLLSRNKELKELVFPPKAVMAINVIECVGLIFMFFTLSARIDKGIVKKSGKLAIVIGVGAFIIPLTVTILTTLFIRDGLELDDELRSTLPMVATLEATISFHVILANLTELKLLNSEIGRLALSSSLLSSLIGWFAPTFYIYASENARVGITRRTVFLMNVSVIVMVIIIVFVVRPIIFWMMRKTPEGKPLKQDHLVALNVIVLVVALVGELTGQNSYLGPFILGITTPVTPPMGSLLADKIQYFVWVAFIPCFIINTGRRVDLYSIQFNHFLAVEMVILIAGTVKTFAIVIPCLYSKIPFMDALALGLLLNCRGIYDIQVFTRAKQRLVRITWRIYLRIVSYAFEGVACSFLFWKQKMLHILSKSSSN